MQSNGEQIVDYLAGQREYQREYKKRRYATDPEYRAKDRARNHKRYADPAYRAKLLKQKQTKYATDPEYRAKDRAATLKHMFRLTFEQYNTMLAAQNGVCCMCKQTCSAGKALAVDHSHRCCPGKKSCGKCIRGLLCGNCNKGLGCLQDSPALLYAGIEYVMKYADKGE